MSIYFYIQSKKRKKSNFQMKKMQICSFNKIVLFRNFMSNHNEDFCLLNYLRSFRTN